MKTNNAFIGLLIMFLCSCASPKYLPSSSKIDVNQYGSYIKIIHKTAANIDGEFIAIDSNKIIVLTEGTKKCVKVAISDIKHFKLRYAKPKHYGLAIPASLALPFMHGLFSILTIPMHLFVTISVSAAGQRAFKYSDKNMTYDKLKMFARYPQGLPPNIALESVN
jgi:hypothetical protein